MKKVLAILIVVCLVAGVLGISAKNAVTKAAATQAAAIKAATE